ncbi:Nuclear import receptor, variant 2 [Basidiobolus ranarum]|uniref:Nuclear import receptor, variant 2 n=1 Tax=Basidiobolus ranarum TaxID=34480 RepID=A0ABR2W5I4_9FUNG
MSAVNVEQVIRVIQTLFGNTDAASKAEANLWLQQIQKTPEAWSLTTEILGDQSIGVEVHTFSAQMLRNKVVADLGELDTSKRFELRDTLMNLLYKYRAGPNLVKTQLCLSLVGLALQLKEWEDPVNQLIQMLGSSQETAGCLLEFLTVLPEEINGNQKVPISRDEYIERSGQLLTGNSENVLQLLISSIQNSGSDSDIQVKLFACLRSWLQSGDIPVSYFNDSPLPDLVFEALESEELFDIAVDVICEIIDESRETEECIPLIGRLRTKFKPLKEMMKQTDIDDRDRLKAFCRIFTEAGEAYLELIVENLEKFRDIVDGILECVNLPDLDTVPMTFYFWCSLASRLQQISDPETMKYFRDIFYSLVDIIIKQLHYPYDLESWSAEDREDFLSFREEIGDVLLDCCHLLGAERSLARPYSLLSNYVSNPEQIQHTQWQDIEAPLVALRSMAIQVEETEDVIVPKVMKLIPHLPPHPKVRVASIMVIAHFSSWTANHPEFIPSQLDYISAGFEHSETASAAAVALNYLCKDCSRHLIDYLSQLHPFYIAAAKSLTQKEMLEITEALAHVISAVPLNNILPVVQTFCFPISEALNELLNKGAIISEEQITQISDLVERIGVFLEFIAPEELYFGERSPVANLIPDLWPLFERLLVTFGDNAIISESICVCLKPCLVYYRQDFVPLLPLSLERIASAFQAGGLSCYLRISKIIVEEYAKNVPESRASLFLLVENLSKSMFEIIRNKSFTDIPDG